MLGAKPFKKRNTIILGIIIVIAFFLNGCYPVLEGVEQPESSKIDVPFNTILHLSDDDPSYQICGSGTAAILLPEGWEVSSFVIYTDLENKTVCERNESLPTPFPAPENYYWWTCQASYVEYCDNADAKVEIIPTTPGNYSLYYTIGYYWSSWVSLDNGTSVLKTTIIWKDNATKNITVLPSLYVSDPLQVSIRVREESSLYGQCSNGIKDENEADVDCGGVCPPCEDGKICNEDSDCLSNYCNPDGMCSTPSCNDGWQNQDESDVDCGGNCEKCENGRSCITGDNMWRLVF